MAVQVLRRGERIIRVSDIVTDESVLCAIIDTGAGEIAAVVNAGWGLSSATEHVLAHVDKGVPGGVICAPGCVVT